MSALFPVEINASGFGAESLVEVSGLLRGQKSEGGRKKIKRKKIEKRGGGRGGETERGRSGEEGERECRYEKKRRSAERRASADRERSNRRII